jgi:hypothetical protein
MLIKGPINKLKIYIPDTIGELNDGRDFSIRAKA